MQILHLLLKIYGTVSILNKKKDLEPFCVIICFALMKKGSHNFKIISILVNPRGQFSGWKGVALAESYQKIQHQL